MGRGWNASDVLLAVLDMYVAGRIFRVGDRLPSEKPGVEIRSSLWIGRAQIGPAKCTGDLSDSDAVALVGLPDAENRAGRILDDRHAARIHDVESRRKDFAVQFLRLGRRSVSA